MSAPVSVLLAGGGSAGHVSPLLALADCLRRRDPGTSIAVLGTAQGLEARLVPAQGYPLHFVPKVPMPRRPGPDLLGLGPKLRSAVRAADQAMTASSAQVVVGFGGYVCPPAYLAARRRGIPIVIHEQNPLPGLANRLGARLTRFVATTYPDTPLPHTIHTGLPLRPQITALAQRGPEDRAQQKAAARAHWGLDPQRTTLLITGGSLGAQRLNESFAAAAPVLRSAGIQVLHISGVGKTVALAESSSEVPYLVVPYVDEMALAYAAADFVVCRSGASTVCELAAVGLAAAYVPLPIGNGEQRLNAEPLVAVGGGLLIEDSQCTASWIQDRLLPVLDDSAQRERMATAAATFAVPHADERLADLVLEAIATGVR